MTTLREQSGTLIEAVRKSLSKAGRYNPADTVCPVVVLWADADGQWKRLVERLRPLMPGLLTLGEYDAETRSGPPIWLRCVIEPSVRAAKFPELVWPEDTVPIIYMPNVSRQTLRAVEECPGALKPLVELQYRGTIWTQKNGKDWTVRAFLVSDDGGTGLDVAEDRLTLRALQGALSQLAVIPMSRLRGKRIEAEDFDKLMIGDPARDLLQWLGDPEGSRERWDEETWSAFNNRCRQDYGFDPEEDGAFLGGEKLGERRDSWQVVWERFAESPSLYPGIPVLLRSVKPKGTLIFDQAPWPDENESMENALRTALMEVGSMTPAEARQRLGQLEQQHAPRRDWVWARLGLCPLANAMAHLATVASRTATALGGDSIEAMVRLYVGGAYLADDGVLRALACVKTADDVEAVRAAVRCVYLPWLEDTARHFQECNSAMELPAVAEQEPVMAEVGDCILFVDGLRFDIGQRLATLAEEEQLEIANAWRWAALPTVTATAKPAVSPVSGKLIGIHLDAEFRPETADAGTPVSTDRLRKLLAAEGHQVLEASEVGDASSANARAWTEYGEFDSLGHRFQCQVAARVDDHLEQLVDRIRGLLAAGWKRVRIMTDHGWLLVPGGMPKTQLPRYLAESRWSRCASIKDSSHVEVPVAGWSWNPQQRFAYGPGVHCFVAGQEYAHGGVSLQECVVPVFTVTASVPSAAAVVTLADVRWVGLRCRLRVDPAVYNLRADLRTKANVSGSSITQPKVVDGDGKTALLVEDESLEGAIASLVLLDEAGNIVLKEPTTVGGDG